jgi:hypothetical protein
MRKVLCRHLWKFQSVLRMFSCNRWHLRSNFSDTRTAQQGGSGSSARGTSGLVIWLWNNNQWSVVCGAGMCGVCGGWSALFLNHPARWHSATIWGVSGSYAALQHPILYQHICLITTVDNDQRHRLLQENVVKHGQLAPVTFMQASAFNHRKSTLAWASLPTSMYWHKVLRQYSSANIGNFGRLRQYVYVSMVSR